MIDESKWEECRSCGNFNTIYAKKCKHCGEPIYNPSISASPIWQMLTFRFLYFGKCGKTRDESHDWKFGTIVLFSEEGLEFDAERYYCKKCGIYEADSNSREASQSE